VSTARCLCNVCGGKVTYLSPQLYLDHVRASSQARHPSAHIPGDLAESPPITHSKRVQIVRNNHDILG